MDVDTAHLLLHEGLDLLDVLERERATGTATPTPLALGTRLRSAGHRPELVAAVLTQLDLRARARAKFGPDATRLLYTADGLEQATRRDVADHHAARFTDAAVLAVTDLGCGLGADALGLRRADVAVRAVDADPATALLAAHNLAAADAGAAAAAYRVDVAFAEDTDLHGLGPTDGAWLDPARRTPGRTDSAGRTRRTFRLEQMSPSWQFVTTLAASVPATGAKLSPAFPHAAVPAGAEAEWVSTSGDLVECAVWWGPLARTAGRTATVLAGGTHATVVARLCEADAAQAPPAGRRPPEPGHWLYEADLAVLQAGLVGALVNACDGDELAEGAGYVASPRRLDIAYARRHRITHVMPARPKTVKAWLRATGAQGVTIKKRGTRIDPADFRRRLGYGTSHGNDATLLIVEGSDGPVALALADE